MNSIDRTISRQLDELFAFLQTSWRPGSLACDYLGREVKIADGELFSLGGAVQKLWPDFDRSSRVMFLISTTSLALNDSTVLSWEDCPNRSLEDVLWHVEASKVCHLSGLMTALNQGTEPPLDAVRRLKRALGTAGLNMAVAA